MNKTFNNQANFLQKSIYRILVLFSQHQCYYSSSKYIMFQVMFWSFHQIRTHLQLCNVDTDVRRNTIILYMLLCNKLTWLLRLVCRKLILNQLVLAAINLGIWALDIRQDLIGVLSTTSWNFGQGWTRDSPYNTWCLTSHLPRLSAMEDEESVHTPKKNSAVYINLQTPTIIL